MDENYEFQVYRSDVRDGFFCGNYILIASLSFNTLSYTDYGNATIGLQNYYMIIPVNETGARGVSSYSIGVWTGIYNMGFDSLGLPLKTESTHSADWFCDAIPYTWGMNYYDILEQRWVWHRTSMPKGAYDPDILMTEGYQISTIRPILYIYIGI
jgi:hypothetical protein